MKKTVLSLTIIIFYPFKEKREKEILDEIREFESERQREREKDSIMIS